MTFVHMNRESEATCFFHGTKKRFFAFYRPKHLTASVSKARFRFTQIHIFRTDATLDVSG